LSGCLGRLLLSQGRVGVGAGAASRRLCCRSCGKSRLLGRALVLYIAGAARSSDDPQAPAFGTFAI
jgi:hypothetical protein